MTTDDGLHLLGTKPIHMVPPIVIGAIATALQSSQIMWFAAGMLTVLIFGNTRCIPTYRWRVDAEN